MGTKNFKSKKDYEKWLAYGHIHKDFEKTPGNQKVTIKGKPHKVKHSKKHYEKHEKRESMSDFDMDDLGDTDDMMFS